MDIKQVKSVVVEKKAVVKNQYFLSKQEGENFLKDNRMDDETGLDFRFCRREEENNKNIYLSLGFMSKVGWMYLDFYLNSKQLFVGEGICDPECNREDMDGIILGEGRKNLLKRFLKEFISQKKHPGAIIFDYEIDKHEQEKLLNKAVRSLEESIKECGKELEKSYYILSEDNVYESSEVYDSPEKAIEGFKKEFGQILKSKNLKDNYEFDVICYPKNQHEDQEIVKTITAKQLKNYLKNLSRTVPEKDEPEVEEEEMEL